MQFDITAMPPGDRYELLLGTVVPRPIAIVTSISTEGAINGAPYSLFNVMGHDPALAMISVLAHPERRLKDTASNVLATKEFVINLVSESIAEAMNITCIDAPPSRNEIDLAGLGTAPSRVVKPPRIAESPVAYECRLLTTLSFGANQSILVGEIVHGYVADQFVIDAKRGLVDTPSLQLIGGMHGAKWYARLSDRFEMERPNWMAWVKEGKVR
jgi:flavin reductase (DIM6/NTAB) family NADH-FMN oxidoreductase RutF